MMKMKGKAKVLTRFNQAFKLPRDVQGGIKNVFKT